MASDAVVSWLRRQRAWAVAALGLHNNAKPSSLLDLAHSSLTRWECRWILNGLNSYIHDQQFSSTISSDTV